LPNKIGKITEKFENVDKIKSQGVALNVAVLFKRSYGRDLLACIAHI
jgi:hypothetical protein